MYDELIEELRRHHCDAKEDDTQEVCEECAYDVIIADKSVPSGIASVCVCGLMNRAADAIEELRKRVPPVPHGDLIDRDALIKEMDKQENAMYEHGREFSFSFKSGGDVCTTWYNVEIMVEDAPTIIPASGGRMMAGVIPYTHDDLKKTNADRIRSMTDEELDKFLGEVQWDVANYCGGVTQKQEYPVPEQRGAWLDWLKEECADG